MTHPMILKLQKASRKLKKSSKKRDQKADWIKFWINLRKQQQQLESELQEYKNECPFQDEFSEDQKIIESKEAVEDTTHVLECFLHLIVQNSELNKEKLLSLQETIQNDISHCEVMWNKLSSEITELVEETQEDQESLVDFESNTEIKILKEEFKLKCIELKISLDGGNWNSQEKICFTRLVNSYTRKNELLQRLKTDLPHKSILEIKKYLRWCTLKQIHIEKLKTIKDRIQREKTEFRFKKERNLIIESGAKIVQKQINLEKEILAKEQEEKFELYKEIKVKTKEQRKIIEKTKAMEAEMNAKREEHLKKLRNQEIIKKKKILHEHRLEINNINQRRNKLEKIRKQELLKIKKKQSKYNQTRIDFRHIKREEKLKELKDLEQKAQQKANFIEEQLQGLRDSVMRTFCVEDDSNRIFKNIECHQYKGKIIERVRNLFPTIGYSDEKLFEDKRFRVAYALAEKGLHNTDYGRFVIKTTISKTLPRKDCFHSEAPFQGS